jgi:hypothetical protein
LDVTTGTDIKAEFFIYGNGHPQAPKYFYVYGQELRDIKYTPSTFGLTFKPVAPSISASYAGGLTAIAGIDFPYYGPGQIVDHTPPIVSGAMVWEDLSRASHPSSQFLLGVSFRADGVNGQEVPFDYVISSKYTAFKKYDLNQALGYIDGGVPASGFSYTLDDSVPSITTSVLGETFKRAPLRNSNFSAHDIQVGVFLRMTNIVRETGGIRLFWNAQGTNKYRIQSYSVLNGASNLVATNITGGTVLDTNGLASPVRYYRLRAE